MKKVLIAGAAVAAFAVTPALAQQTVVRGDSTQARSQMSQTAPMYHPRSGGGYAVNFNHGYATGYNAAPSAMGYAPQGYVAAGPYAAVGTPYGFMALGVDGAFNPGVSDQERSQYTQFAPTIGWPGEPRGW